jgi:hypothetical protein
MSKTPRCNKQTITWIGDCVGYVPLAFARELETELAAALAAKDRAEAAERSLSEQVKAMDAALADAERDAKRYSKLRGWMSSGVDEGWNEVQKLAAIACYLSWDDFDSTLDMLQQCNVGLMHKADAALAADSERVSVPREPTEAMEDAFFADGGISKPDWLREGYKRMLAAAEKEPRP